MLTMIAWSAVYSYSMLFRFALSLASPVHSYGAHADILIYPFITRRLFALLIIVSVIIDDWKSVT